MSAERDKRQPQDEAGVSEDAGAIEASGLAPNENDKAAQPQQSEDPPEELEEERRG